MRHLNRFVCPLLLFFAATGFVRSDDGISGERKIRVIPNREDNSSEEKIQKRLEQTPRVIVFKSDDLQTLAHYSWDEVSASFGNDFRLRPTGKNDKRLLLKGAHNIYFFGVPSLIENDWWRQSGTQKKTAKTDTWDYDFIVGAAYVKPIGRDEVLKLSKEAKQNYLTLLLFKTTYGGKEIILGYTMSLKFVLFIDESTPSGAVWTYDGKIAQLFGFSNDDDVDVNEVFELLKNYKLEKR
jgi:hypothetical protein